MTRFALLAIVVACGSAPARAADPTYWQDIRPLLRKHCTVCHSARKLAEPDVSAGLALDTPAAVRAGGKVPVLVPGKPDQSLLATLLTAKDAKRRMPLDADPLPAEAVAVIRKWVAAGAPEGTRPAEAETAGVNPAARPANVRKLPVMFVVRATQPKGSAVAGPVTLTLPVGPLPPVAAVAFSPDGKLLAAGAYGRVTVWDLAAARPAKVLTNVLGAVNDLKFSPDGTRLAVAGGQPSARGDLRLFDTKDWKLVASLGGHLDTVSGVAWSPDGAALASASFDKTVRLWDVKSAAVRHTFTGHSDFVYAVAFSPKGDWYATASKDRTGRVVDAATGTGLVTFSGMEQDVLAVAVRPGGGQVVTSGYETAVSWWDAKTAERTRRTGGPGVSVNELAFDAKGATLAVAGGDGTIRLYDAATGTAGKLVQPGSAVFALALDPAGKRLAGGTADGLVRVWDAADVRLVGTFWGGPGDWLAVADGCYAASDGVAATGVWKGDGKPVADATALAPLKDAARVGKALAVPK